MSDGGDNPKSAAPRLNQYYWYTPRFWEGMRTGTFWHLLARHRFAIAPSRLDNLLFGMVLPPVHSVCHRWQELRWRRRIAAAVELRAPVFILGHWRSGTTLLHELLIRDDRHTYPTTYDCFSPSDVLSTSAFVRRWFSFLVPQRRPMDNMAAGWDRPQEDEFAMMNLGLPTIYETLAFPNQGPCGLERLDHDALEPEQQLRYQQALRWFLTRIHVRDPRRIVLKSPPHLGRLRCLAEMFPAARFVHIVRQPGEVYASSLRLWQALFQTQSFQVPTHEGLEAFVDRVFRDLYVAFHRQRAEIDASRICDVRYEDLVADPVAEIERVYGELQLGEFDAVRPALESHVEHIKHYRRNRHRLDDATQQAVHERWNDYCQRYGY